MMEPDDLRTREKILQTAFGLFLAKGYENTPVQAIIDAVGIAKGTFYHHFKAKEEMLVVMIEGMSLRVVEALRSVVEDPGLDAVTKLLRASQVAVGQKTADFGPETLVLVRQMRLPSNRRLADAIDRIYTQWVRPLYVRCIRQGVAEGMFHVRDPDLAADLILGTILSLKDKVSDLLLEAGEGVHGAVDRLLRVYEAIEQAIERVLGVPEGTLPIYTSIDLRGLLGRLGAVP